MANDSEINLDRLSEVRARFPALKQDQIFFDNAGGSQTLGTVVDSICNYLTTTNVQLGASYRVGKACTERYSAGVVAGSRFINAQPDEIVFGSSTTQLYRNLSWTLEFQEGDEIIVSSVDHEANIAPWLDLARRQKLVVNFWTPAKSANPKLEPEDLEKVLSPKTRLVACTHCSNILGSINDIKGIASTVHKIPGAMLVVDGVAYAPHRQLDVKDLGVDFYCFSWYKVYGPHISMLYASRKAQEKMRPLSHFFQPKETLDNKLGLAGASYELMQAIPAVVEYLPPGSIAWAGVKSIEHALQLTLLDYLNSRPDIFTVYGETSSGLELRVPTVSFTVKDWDSRKFVETVESQTNYGFRWGAFYSNRLAYEVLGLGPDGAVRISMVHYNTIEEVKGIIKAIEEVLGGK